MPVIGRGEFGRRVKPVEPVFRAFTQPEEIARSALYLASDQSSFTTGSMLMAGGGMNI